MVVNETIVLANQSLVYDVVSSFGKASIGPYVNQILFVVGGLGSATLIYFGVVIWFQWRQWKQNEEELELIRLELVLIDEQYKMLKEIHKVYYPAQQNNNDENQNRPKGVRQPDWLHVPRSVYDTTRHLLHKLSTKHAVSFGKRSPRVLLNTSKRTNPHEQEHFVSTSQPVVPTVGSGSTEQREYEVGAEQDTLGDGVLLPEQLSRSNK